MEYNKDIIIDEYNLEKEWLRQPSLFLKYSQAAEIAGAKYRKLKDDLEIIKASLYKTTKQKMIEDGEKVTEGAVNNAIITNKEYMEDLNIMQEAQHDFNMLSAAVKAFDQRKSALENLVKLYLSGYFSAPSEKDNYKDTALDSVSKKQMENLNKKEK